MIHQAPPKESMLIEFLLGHIRKDLEHLADCCERSLDDCYIVLHEVLSAMEDAAGKIILHELSSYSLYCLAQKFKKPIS